MRDTVFRLEHQTVAFALAEGSLSAHLRVSWSLDAVAAYVEANWVVREGLREIFPCRTHALDLDCAACFAHALNCAAELFVEVELLHLLVLWLVALAIFSFTVLGNEAYEGHSIAELHKRFILKTQAERLESLCPQLLRQHFLGLEILPDELV